MWFDTHAHLQDEAFTEIFDQIVNQLTVAGITQVVLPGSSVEDSARALEIAAVYPNFHVAVGVHPEAASECNGTEIKCLEEMIQADLEKFAQTGQRKIVAIGEIGLDYHYPGYLPQVQKELFWQQIKLAAKYKLPIVVHIRDSFRDSLDMLQEARRQGLLLTEDAGVLHCYSGSAELVSEALDLGFCLGFDGPITFKNSKKAPDVLRAVPIERLVIETDSPYLSPEPLRGKLNSPANLPLIGAKVAEFKGLSPAEVQRITYDNACRLFRLA